MRLEKDDHAISRGKQLVAKYQKEMALCVQFCRCDLCSHIERILYRGVNSGMPVSSDVRMKGSLPVC